MTKKYNTAECVAFVQHIQSHLDAKQSVICTICKKSVEEIALEEKQNMDKPITEIDLEGKFVVMDKKGFKAEYRDIVYRIFFCTGGFGCNPLTVGTKIIGNFVVDGEECYIRRYDVERIATEEEVLNAKAFAIQRQNYRQNPKDFGRRNKE